jgi:hypothetical protein
MKTSTKMTLGAVLWSAMFLHPATLPAQGTAFTYQGRLDADGTPANGSFDLRFGIYDAASGGSPLAGPLTNAATGVSNGLFTVALDFGAGVFPGSNRWLEVAVRTNGGGAFTTLTPRQPITASPYAITAGQVTGALPAAQLTGTVPDGVLSANVTLLGPTIEAAEVDAPTFNTTFWRTAGNACTTPGAHFMGTSDNQRVELRVNNARALPLEPAASGSINVVGGFAGNHAAAGVLGATIGGGGAGNWFGLVFTNSVSGDFDTVGGGQRNTTAGFAATVSSGQQNNATNSWATVSPSSSVRAAYRRIFGSSRDVLFQNRTGEGDPLAVVENRPL